MKKIISLCLAFILIGGFTMARGTPDGGQSLSSSPVSQVFDPGENTTRLLMGGGANSRSGRWLWATGFESGLAEVKPFGTFAAVVLDSANTYMGRASAKLQIDPAQNGAVNLQKYLFNPVTQGVPNRYGQEAMVAFEIKNFASVFQWRAVSPDIENITTRYTDYRIELRITGNNAGKLFYANAAGVYVEFADVSPQLWATLTGLFHYTKLVYDANSLEYVRFTFDDKTWDLSGIKAQTFAGNGTYMYNSLRFSALASASPPNCWVDNWVLTADEP